MLFLLKNVKKCKMDRVQNYHIKTSKLDNKELLEVQKQVESFLKFLNSEYDTVKKLEEENS